MGNYFPRKKIPMKTSGVLEVFHVESDPMRGRPLQNVRYTAFDQSFKHKNYDFLRRVVGEN